MRVTFVLEGDLDRLRIPPPRPPRIAERLWQHTCCEIFDPQIRVQRGAERLELDALIRLRDGGKLLIGLSAVIEDEDGLLSYWALRHPPGKPDFHHPDAFALELDEVRH